MRAVIACKVLITLSLATPAWGQDVPGPSTAEKEHEWLGQFVGEWDAVSEGSAGPNQPATKSKGTMSARMLGKIWVVSESTVSVMGTEISAIQTIGYDPQKKKFIGTWIDSMFNHLWQYEGTIDDAGRTLTLEAEGPNFAQPGKVTRYRDAYHFDSKDHIVVTSSILGDDGKWATFMTGDYTRRK